MVMLVAVIVVMITLRGKTGLRGFATAVEVGFYRANSSIDGNPKADRTDRHGERKCDGYLSSMQLGENSKGGDIGRWPSEEEGERCSG